jgi:hypothetical protein
MTQLTHIAWPAIATQPGIGCTAQPLWNQSVSLRTLPQPLLCQQQHIIPPLPLLVDVGFGRGRTLYALSQGDFQAGNPEGSPTLPNTGALVQVNGDGTFTVVTDGLNQPTSVEFIRNTAYVVTLTGEIWKIDGVSGPPHSASR